MVKRIYFFADGQAEADKTMKDIVGGKGAGLAEMNHLGIPVPAGFTIAASECNEYYKNGKAISDELKAEVKVNLAKVEEKMGQKFGDVSGKMPLLFSIRSGARVSMPGMMDTVLNLGLTPKCVEQMSKITNEHFAWDSYRRFVQMYSNVVMGMDTRRLEEVLEEKKEKNGYKSDVEMTVADLKDLVSKYLPIVKELTGKDFPEDAEEQLWGAIGAVFSSWDVPRAIAYRKMNNIGDDWGTAVNVQAMVFGNMSKNSATGVAFSRDPLNGDNKFYGEWLPQAQGEDVVAGIRTPQPINSENDNADGLQTLEEAQPVCYKELVAIYKKLEAHFRDMQDIEFTIQDGKLYLLQCRIGKRTAAAAIKIAVDMVEEGLITKEEAVLRVEPNQLDQLLHPTLDPKAEKKVIAKGIAASPGAASGIAVFSAEEAQKCKDAKVKCILVRLETTPEDIEGMAAAEGVLTARGGKTSHAAVVARGMGKCCVCGCSDITFNADHTSVTLASGGTIKAGDHVTLDGTLGEVYAGAIKTVSAEISGNFKTLMSWADAERRLEVRTNADTPRDSQVARDFGAQGIGLTRTEHMFFEASRILHMREMILSNTDEEREAALNKLLKFQREDFYGILKAMKGLPVNIRTLDPPLHEFLPHTEEEIKAVADELKVTADQLKDKINALHEVNPMLGHRGCRLGITIPHITRMQARAIFEASAQLTKEGVEVHPEVMIPLIGTLAELENQKKEVLAIGDKVKAETGVDFHYKVGTMIEIPRAAIVADKIASVAEFFSFGTNDLTQMTFGYSRDDAGKFLPYYVDHKILPADPFQTVDQEGVGFLMKRAVTLGRKQRPELTCGICGEHGGEPKSVVFCHEIGLDYVSCSPFRVPIARLAAAHAAINEKLNKA